MPLTDVTVRSAKPRKENEKLTDERNLYLLLRLDGRHRWRWDYVRPSGTRNTLSFGVYPEVSLKRARAKRDEARILLDDGIDPGLKRKSEMAASADSVEAVAREWFAKHSPRWADTHSSKIITRLEKDIFPWLGVRRISSITPPDLLTCFRRVEARGAADTAHRVFQNCGQVWRYAVATGRIERDITADLRGALAPTTHEHYAAITEPDEAAALLRAIDGYQGSLIVRCALQLLPLVFTRPGELRAAEWHEFDLEKATWIIPSTRMKLRRDHVVPLSKQVLTVLRELQPLTGEGRYLFPSMRSWAKPMSENTINGGLRRLGFDKTEMSGHGFRAMARTILDEVLGYRIEWIEHQLAHAVKDPNGRAYNRTAHLSGRREMMQGWADYLDDLKSRKVVRSAHSEREREDRANH